MPRKRHKYLKRKRHARFKKGSLAAKRFMASIRRKKGRSGISKKEKVRHSKRKRYGIKIPRSQNTLGAVIVLGAVGGMAVGPLVSLGSSTPPPPPPPPPPPVNDVIALSTPTVNNLAVSINGSVNPAPSALDVNWGDGVAFSFPGFPASHTYVNPGTYTITVTATSTTGNTGSATESVTVSNPVNNSTISGSYAPVSGTPGGYITISGSGFTPNASITLNFSAPGINTSVPTTATSTGTIYYQEADVPPVGTVTWTISATDNSNNIRSNTITVTVPGSGSNPPPANATLTVTPSSLITNQSATVVISGSGFTPGSTIALTAASKPFGGTIIADSNGAFSESFGYPGGGVLDGVIASGQTFTIIATSGSTTASATFTPTLPSGGGGGSGTSMTVNVNVGSYPSFNPTITTTGSPTSTDLSNFKQYAYYAFESGNLPTNFNYGTRPDGTTGTLSGYYYNLLLAAGYTNVSQTGSLFTMSK